MAIMTTVASWDLRYGMRLINGREGCDGVTGSIVPNEAFLAYP
jgi:hypothetical protein